MHFCGIIFNMNIVPVFFHAGYIDFEVMLMFSETLKKLATTEHITSIVIIIAVVVLLISGRWFYRSLLRQKKITDRFSANAIRIIYETLRALLLFGTVLVILQINGVNVSSLVTGLGIASVIVGLALQDPLRDMLNGLHIISNEFFQAGEVVEWDGREWTVTSISLRTTKLSDVETRDEMTVSNREISQICRLSGILDIDVPLSYDDDFHRIGKTLERICEKIGCLPTVDSCSYLGIEKFDSSAILYRIRISCPPQERRSVSRSANGIIFEGLNRAGFTIPFNQLDVHCDISTDKQI